MLQDCSMSDSVKTSLLLESRSLIILQGDLYNLYPHSIDQKDKDVISTNICNINMCSQEYKLGDVLNRGTRISLTIRHVPHTSKFKLKFFK